MFNCESKELSEAPKTFPIKSQKQDCEIIQKIDIC